jgi:TonB family protein
MQVPPPVIASPSAAPTGLYQQIAASSGMTILRLAISDGGRVTDCTIETSSGVPALDRRACTIALDKGRYRPATDKDGKPVSSNKRLKIVWRQGE